MTNTDVLDGRCILVVEDDYLIASDLADALRDQGAVVLGPVPSVEAALRLIGDGSTMDGALLDVNLRGEMVFPIADALLQRRVPFVFATGYDENAIPLRYAHVSCHEKPLDLAKAATALFS